MLQHPRFHPHLHVEVVRGEGVFLISPARQTLLRGRLYELVAPWLDGRTPNELCDRLQDTATPAEVFYTLAQLERKEYLCEQEAALPAGQAALWSSQQIAPAMAARRLADRPIVVRAFGVNVQPFLDLLQSLHVRLADSGPADVVIADNYLRAELETCNVEALARERPWMLVRPTGRQVLIGPVFRPGATGCWRCLAQRLRANSPVASYLEERNGRAGMAGHDAAATPATLQVAWGLAAQAVATWIVRGATAELDGKVQTFDIPSWKLQSHTLVRLPYCPACGRPGEARPFQPPTLASRKKTFTADGGHRVVAPEATLARHGHHVSALTGAVPMLERAGPADDEVLHVYLAGNNMARPHYNLAHLRGDLRNMSAGKGTSDVQAKASGLCEGLERYSGVFRGDEPRRHARMRDLGEAAIDPHSYLLFSDRQYRERDVRNNEGCSRFSFIPVPFDPEAEIEWSPVWSLTRRETRYLPTASVYYDYPLSEDHLFCSACSNGNAAGNTLEEAVLQGFLELVERDSVALWWYSRVCRPGVDLHSFAEPYLARLQAFLGEHGREYWVIDLTADLDIPVFASISRRTHGPQEQIVLGFGAHLDPRIALLRAVTEMNQMLTSPLLNGEELAAGRRDVDPETSQWLRTATVANQPYLLPSTESPRTSRSYACTWSDDVIEDVRACQARVERAGLEMLVLDQTQPEIGLPVAKVVVPGLRHFWARFAPGRLYDVPCRLGWIAAPLAEEKLNPIPMFL
jgi:oxazoline/thiazoline synthase